MILVIYNLELHDVLVCNTCEVLLLYACQCCVCHYTRFLHHQEQLKQRDQSLRKQEQEMDSLSFRNQQLAKRVELLQEELAASEAKGKKGKVNKREIQGGSVWLGG